MFNVATSTIEVLCVDIDSAEFAGEVNMVQIDVGLVPDTSKLEHLGAVSLDRVGIGVGLSREEREVGRVRDLADGHMRLIRKAKSKFVIQDILLGLVELQDRSVVGSFEHFYL